MTASFQRRAANSKFETESSERQAPDQEAASKKGLSSENQTTKRTANIEEAATNSKKQGKRSESGQQEAHCRKNNDQPATREKK